MIIDLDRYCTQQEFGDLVGISQPAVSEHLAAGVLTPGQTMGQWHADYIEHLREEAAGRGADGELARQRTIATRVARERNEIELAKDRKEFMAVNLIEQVIASVASQIRDHLQGLPPAMKMRCPHLSADDLKIIETCTFEAINLAASMSLASLDAMDAEDNEATA
jgi:phage terminase Nu1 subunit (DNA packaging protein)